jgi:hypothetical protein
VSTSLLQLHDEVADLVALAHISKRRPPGVAIRWDLAAGEHLLTVVVQAEVVVQAAGPSLESAAARALEQFRAWADANTLVHALSEEDVQAIRFARGEVA